MERFCPAGKICPSEIKRKVGNTRATPPVSQLPKCAMENTGQSLRVAGLRLLSTSVGWRCGNSRPGSDLSRGAGEPALPGLVSDVLNGQYR